MALIRTFLPGQFRDNFLGSVGPFQVTATIASTAAGANGSAQASAVAGSAPALAALLQASDMIIEIIPATPQTAGVSFTATVTANGVLWLTASNGTGGAYNPGAQTFTVFALRLKTA